MHRSECKWQTHLEQSYPPAAWWRSLYKHTGMRLHDIVLWYQLLLYCKVHRLECKQRTHLEQIFVSLRPARELRDAKVHSTNMQTGPSTLCMPLLFQPHLEGVQVGVQTTNAQMFPARVIGVRSCRPHYVCMLRCRVCMGHSANYERTLKKFLQAAHQPGLEAFIVWTDGHEPPHALRFIL